MYWLRRNTHRMLLAVLLGAVLTLGTAGGDKREPPGAALAWWGTLYPEFCFSGNLQKEEGEEGRFKTCFWIGEMLSRLFEGQS